MAGVLHCSDAWRVLYPHPASPMAAFDLLFRSPSEGLHPAPTPRGAVDVVPPTISRAGELLHWLRAAEQPGSGRLLRPPVVQSVHEGKMVHLEGAPVRSIHVVRCGAFKCVRVLEDGYEQVVSFADRGDVLGFDGLNRGRHVTSAIALEDSTVYMLPVDELEAMTTVAPELGRALHAVISRELADARRTADMMAAVCSETRLARFLLWCSDRAAERGESARRLRLRMGRRELASLLGVAHETVSRCFTNLARQGVLRVDNREIEILDAPALLAHTRGTRRGAEDGSMRRADAPRALARALARAAEPEAAAWQPR